MDAMDLSETEMMRRIWIGTVLLVMLVNSKPTCSADQLPNTAQVDTAWVDTAQVDTTRVSAVARAAGAVAKNRTDGDARYLHHIDLYDSENRKITPESNQPYSPRNTCGRCHDYDTISHGWHFNAFEANASAGGSGATADRVGEPWVWTDARTGTQLPLSYRNWRHLFHPSEAGLSSWAMTHHFGGRIPGGGMGEDGKIGGKAQSPSPAPVQSDDSLQSADQRWALSGTLEIDCMACHAVAGVYDMNERRRQISKQNFAWAPTAALRLGDIAGDVSRIRGSNDPSDEEVKKKLPSVTYDQRRFASDGSVFIDLVRSPTSNACYQCHSQRSVDDNGVQQRWSHDEDVHIQSGMQCVDCHRNGLDHQMVRGFVGQDHVPTDSMVTLTCAGCHLGSEAAGPLLDETSPWRNHQAGRLGSPKPLHHGLPAIHFEKLACTACHSGQAPRETATRIMTSLAHHLGEKGRRKGHELPAMLSGVFTKGSDGRIYPHKAIWPAYWGIAEDVVYETDAADGIRSITPLSPDDVYQWVRKTLGVRRDWVKELTLPKLDSDQRQEVLGEERGRVDSSDWTASERDAIKSRQRELGETQFQTKVAASLIAIEQETQRRPAVYVSGGRVFAANTEGDGLIQLDSDSVDSSRVGMITWPMAHNVRPAGWSLGVAGCTECHSDQGAIFASTVSPVGPVNDDASVVSMASLQGVDTVQLATWNQMFAGRTSFKYLVATSLVVLGGVLVWGPRRNA